MNSFATTALNSSFGSTAQINTQRNAQVGSVELDRNISNGATGQKSREPISTSKIVSLTIQLEPEQIEIQETLKANPIQEAKPLTYLSNGKPNFQPLPKGSMIDIIV